jgi:hypothetical protein
MADNGSGVGTGMIAGILVAIVAIAVVFLFASGTLNLGGKKDVDINVELPKAPEAPAVPTPGNQ